MNFSIIPSRLKKVLFVPALVVAILGPSPAVLQADVLSSVPRQGGMLMPEVYYHADSDSVTVDLSSITSAAQLTPLLISNPGGSFNPADPWFQSLDPSQQGLAFSRRYGFDMDVMSDFVPANRALWIRKLSGSPELSFFDCIDHSSPFAWKAILGTAGTTNAVYWNEMMWHIGVTAPPGTNSYSATFEVIVINTETGLEVANSSSGPFLLDWTDVPDGRPTLAIAGETTHSLLLTWPTSATNWIVVSSPSLSSTNWTVVTNSLVSTESQLAIRVENTEGHSFFRLRRNP